MKWTMPSMNIFILVKKALWAARALVVEAADAIKKTCKQTGQVGGKPLD